ncbi:hypothetical protein [Streptomyces filamentosus]|uniref:hypothetical protein n=1 Tax=Streptomyces filamentosus TaxID=67294 RepID=UPI00123C6FBA|nr:hypothetical protein [Streptomyces filamentosus]KAA6211779.1 hypothetical protein CP979_36030 [Streptomyces filamentosus]KAA6220003.1 hypothetical protein CP979_26230 [Streptomyces filamentosus]KAA6220054.1 hypothetical protein CP979_26520 [Streptomyces filamentosus]
MAIIRAETYYLPPPHLPPNAWAGEPPAMLVVRWWEERHQRRIVVGEGLLLEPVYAQINHGRWVASCACGSAQIVSPADPRMWCVECSTGWWQVAFPPDPAAVEASLDGLLPAEQNWWAAADPADPMRPTLEV